MWTAKELWQDFNRWGLVNEYGYVAKRRDATRQWRNERFANEHDAQRRARQLNDLLPDPLPVMDKLLVSDELTADAASVLSASEPEYAIIEVASDGFGNETAFVVENAPGFHECLAECPQGYGLRRWIRDAGFNIINAHSLLFTEDIPAADVIPFDGSTSQDVIDRKPNSSTEDSRDAAGVGSGSF